MKKGTCLLIDISISGERNLIKKEAGKIYCQKIIDSTHWYKDLQNCE
jgi:hypothetical protein